jgi:hypothetical protein
VGSRSVRVVLIFAVVRIFVSVFDGGSLGRRRTGGGSRHRRRRSEENDGHERAQGCGDFDFVRVTMWKRGRRMT